jgi:hypothetical protein
MMPPLPRLGHVLRKLMQEGGVALAELATATQPGLSPALSGSSSDYLAGDGTFTALPSGSDPWTYVVLTSDLSVTSTSSVASSLTFSPSTAAAVYFVEAELLLETKDTACGARPGVAWHTGASHGSARITAPETASSELLLFLPAGTDGMVETTELPLVTTDYLGRLASVFVNGASPSGSFKVTLASGTGAIVLLKAGSFLRYRTL